MHPCSSAYPIQGHGGGGGLDPINAIGVLPGQVCLWAITWRQMTIHTHFHTYMQFRITS